MAALCACFAAQTYADFSNMVWGKHQSEQSCSVALLPGLQMWFRRRCAPRGQRVVFVQLSGLRAIPCCCIGQAGSAMPNGGAQNIPGYRRTLRLWHRAAREAARTRLRAALTASGLTGDLLPNVVALILDFLLPPGGWPENDWWGP